MNEACIRLSTVGWFIVLLLCIALPLELGSRTRKWRWFLKWPVMIASWGPYWYIYWSFFAPRIHALWGI